MISQILHTLRGKFILTISVGAIAMEEMNATVLEVAKNAQLAAGVSGNAQKQTMEGVQIVSTAVENIKSIHADHRGVGNAQGPLLRP